MVTQYARWLLRWRWPVMIVTLLVVGGIASGMRQLEFTNDYRAFFSDENPQRKAFDAMQDAYAKTDNVMFVITASDGAIFTPATLNAVQWLTEQAWKMPFSNRVESITNFQHTYAEDDDLTVTDLVTDADHLSRAELEQLRQVAINEPVLIKRLINHDASVTAVNVTFQLPGKSLTEVPEVADYARQLAKELQTLNPNLRVDLTGVLMLNDTFDRESAGDMKRLLPIMFALVVAIIWLMLRSLSALFITLLVIMMSIVIGMGFFGWTGLKLTAPMTTAPTVLLTIAVADAVHLFVSFLAGLRQGMNREDAMVESLRVNFSPVTVTSLTTIIGFLTMNFSDAPPLAHLGNTVAVGVAGAWILSLVFLPALAVCMPFKSHTANNHAPGYGFFNALSRVVIKFRRAILVTTTFITLISLWLIPNNQINDQFVDYFDPEVEFRKATDYASSVLLGPYSLDISIESDHENGIADPAFLRKVEAFAVFAQQQPEVNHVFSLTDVFKRLNKNMHGDDQTYYRLPDSSELSSQYLLMYEMSLPYGMDLTNQINLDKSATRVSLALQNISSAELLVLETRITNWFANQHPELTARIASTTSIFAHIGQRNAASQTLGVTLSLFLISMVLIVIMRSVKIGLISLVPNLIPLVIAFGIWAVIDGQIGITLAITAGMTLGIVVDDTVHFLSKYLRARREHHCSAEQAIRASFNQVGPALLSTTIILICGFSVLLFSKFKLNADLGLMASMTIAIALILDFLALPALLSYLDGDKKHVESRTENTDNVVEPGVA